jgi:hypothetical protein
MYQLHLTTHKTKKGYKSKLDGFYSLNTSTLHNSFCQKMFSSDNDNLICHSCYAKNLEKRYFKKTDKLDINARILSGSILLWDHVPFYPLLSVLRIHSIGELINDIHFINIVLIARKNPHCTVSIWTKRPDIVKRVFKSGYSKPDNLILIYSNPRVNLDVEIKPPEYFDKVFNNYTKEYSVENNVDINCHKSCKNCMICYRQNNVEQIKELVK